MAAEAVEGRGGAKGNAVRSSTRQTQSWVSVSQAMDRIRAPQGGKKDPADGAPAPCER